MMTDEAIAVLDRFLDTAMMGKLDERDHHPLERAPAPCARRCGST